MAAILRRYVAAVCVAPCSGPVVVDRCKCFHRSKAQHPQGCVQRHGYGEHYRQERADPPSGFPAPSAPARPFLSFHDRSPLLPYLYDGLSSGPTGGPSLSAVMAHALVSRHFLLHRRIHQLDQLQHAAKAPCLPLIQPCDLSLPGGVLPAGDMHHKGLLHHLLPPPHCGHPSLPL